MTRRNEALIRRGLPMPVLVLTTIMISCGGEHSRDGALESEPIKACEEFAAHYARCVEKSGGEARAASERHLAAMRASLNVARTRGEREHLATSCTVAAARLANSCR